MKQCVQAGLSALAYSQLEPECLFRIRELASLAIVICQRDLSAANHRFDTEGWITVLVFYCIRPAVLGSRGPSPAVAVAV